jgi:hypothetical protein
MSAVANEAEAAGRYCLKRDRTAVPVPDVDRDRSAQRSQCLRKRQIPVGRIVNVWIPDVTAIAEYRGSL